MAVTKVGTRRNEDTFALKSKTINVSSAGT